MPTYELENTCSRVRVYPLGGYEMPTNVPFKGLWRRLTYAPSRGQPRAVKPPPTEPLTYKDAGVDLDAADRLVASIQPLIDSTARPEVVASPGGFAGLCAIPAGYREPLLVASTDGVGTKLASALDTGRHHTIGIDLVAMAVNDVITCGAEPLFFLDYLAVGRLQPDVAHAVVAGIADGCRQAGCALIGGETAEMPGFYAGGRYDLAGFCLGVVERSEVRDGRAIEAGDVVLGLPSSGLHANGHALARKVLLARHGYDDAPSALGGATLADELVRPTVIYAPAFARLRERGVSYRGAAHITGGGLLANPARILPEPDLAVRLDSGSWTEPAVFALIAQAGVARAEMLRTFNMGIGMILVVAPADVDAALAAVDAAVDKPGGEYGGEPGGEPEDDCGARVIGAIVSRDPATEPAVQL